MKCPECGVEAERQTIVGRQGIITVTNVIDVCPTHGNFARFPEDDTKPPVMVVWGGSHVNAKETPRGRETRIRGRRELGV